MVSKSTTKYPVPVTHGFNTSRMMEIVERHYMLNRSAVSPDTDKLAHFLAKLLDAEIIEAGAGEICLKWKIPDNWYVKEAFISNLDGEKIVDFSDHPLLLWTHAIPFEGIVDRDELIEEHVITDPKRPEEFMYHYMNGYKENVREWGFSLPYNLVKNLSDKQYFVKIDSALNLDNTLKVVDASIEGEHTDTIFLMAHTCHPGQVGDGLACIAIASEIYFWLRSRGTKPKYTYKFLFGPEYFGGAAWLAKSDKVQNMKFGFFLDMLSSHEPIGFQKSMQGNSLVDRICNNVFASHKEIFVEREFRKLWGNDETLFNGNSFKIPTVGVGRAMHREYHYNTDNLENMSMYNMVESAWILSRIITVFEEDYVPILNYQGPLYLSRYGLFIDPSEDKDGYLNLEKIQAYADGTNSVFEIAERFNLDFYYVKEFFDKLIEKNLCNRTQRKMNLSDSGFL